MINDLLVNPVNLRPMHEFLRKYFVLEVINLPSNFIWKNRKAPLVSRRGTYFPIQPMSKLRAQNFTCIIEKFLLEALCVFAKSTLDIAIIRAIVCLLQFCPT